MAGQERQKSPGIALLLSFVPGLGALYNGEILKGFSFMGFFAFLIYLLATGKASGWEPLLAIALGIFYFYTIIDTYLSCKRDANAFGEEKIGSEERAAKDAGDHRPDPFLGILFLSSGIIFLLLNYNVIQWGTVRRFWPVLFILIGGKLIWNALKKEA